MRRKDREIADRAQINDIIETCRCCRLGFNDKGRVYIVPLSFGFEDVGGRRVFYFHSAAEGRKLELINSERYAGFELDTGFELHEAEQACSYSAGFQSVIGAGSVELIEDAEQKKHALRCIMKHNTGKTDWEFSPAMLDKVAVFKLEADELSCKEHK